jgi:hypothetical protein
MLSLGKPSIRQTRKIVLILDRKSTFCFTIIRKFNLKNLTMRISNQDLSLILLMSFAILSLFVLFLQSDREIKKLERESSRLDQELIALQH